MPGRALRPGVAAGLVRVGDARVTLRDEPDASADLVVGDAFGGRSLPWHLATAEFAAEARRVLRPRGAEVARLARGADVLRDDDAPADQLLTPLT